MQYVEGCIGDASDYGSDLDEEAEIQLEQLLDDLEVSRGQPLVLESIEENNERRNFAFVPTTVRSPWFVATGEISEGARSPLNVQYDHDGDLVHVREQVEQVPQRAVFPNVIGSQEPKPTSEIPDTRTPLERFRTAPKKPLSVTDLISPAWCELQYWYSLTKFGRKKRTPAMKQGSAVHKVLEKEVHDTVPIDTETREDMWGLRIWNIIQGLRTLRVTGMTRELEIWGVIDGQVVNGVIDEVSFTCTDPELEARIESADRKKSEETEVPADQTTISQFFACARTENANTEADEQAQNLAAETRKVYLTDVKTRGSSTLPAGASLRPTLMQLMIYRRLLVDLATNSVKADVIFSRYRLNATSTFSDSLIAQLGSLDLNFAPSAISSADDTTDAINELLAHNSIHSLWQLMIHEFFLTLPCGVSSVSKILRAEFRNAQDGKVIGAKMFLHDEANLQEYVMDEMRWWKGEREARGVEIEEAFKCRICEFAEGCSWRNTKMEDAVRKARTKRRGLSAVPAA